MKLKILKPNHMSKREDLKRRENGRLSKSTTVSTTDRLCGGRK